MNIAIVGTGYVGLVSGTCFAEMGVDVTCVDVNKEKIPKGGIPIYEPRLDEMVLRNQHEGGLHFTTDISSCLDDVEIVVFNENQKSILFKKLSKHYNGNLNGKRIAIWGLSFKAETDDMREATSLVTIQLLLEAGSIVKVFDPVAMDECKRRIGDTVTYSKDMYDTVLNADALLLLTEWKQFRLPSWGVIKKSMKLPLVIDGRNSYDCDEMNKNGFDYYCIGK